MTSAMLAAEAACATRAPLVMQRTIAAGAVAYERRRDLPKLLGHKCLIMDDGEIVEALEHAVGAAARNARTGHHSYDMNRHIALRQALDGERARASE